METLANEFGQRVLPHFASYNAHEIKASQDAALKYTLHKAAAHLSANVYEIEPLLISPRGKGVKCPRDGRLDSAYVDAIEPADVGPATVMLS